MSRLIRNELIKILKKKSTYIILVITLVFAIFNNYMYKFQYKDYNKYSVSQRYIESIKEEIKQLDPNKASDMNLYIEYKTEIDTYELAKKYKDDSWQQYIVYSQVNGYIQESNTYRYGIDKNEKKAKEIEQKGKEILQKLNSDDWKYFAYQEKQNIEKSLADLEKQKNKTEDKIALKEIQENIEMKLNELEAVQYRIDKDIAYGNTYKNTAIESFISASQAIRNYENISEPNFEDKQEYQEAKNEYEKSKYIIESGQDIEKIDNLRGGILDLFTNYELFIIVFIVMIAGAIVSEEFNKGTVKLLLVRPYSRVKILLSKYITSILMILFIILSIFIMQFIVGGVMFGFESLQVPVINYDFITNSLSVMNIWQYMAILILTKLPLYILIMTIAFGFSTIFTNSALAITISLLAYMSTTIINALAQTYNISILKYFITTNWNIDKYLFGGLGVMDNMTMPLSVMICAIYLAVMLIPTFVVFKKRNIKNI